VSSAFSPSSSGSGPGSQQPAVKSTLVSESPPSTAAATAAAAAIAEVEVELEDKVEVEVEMELAAVDKVGFVAAPRRTLPPGMEIIVALDAAEFTVAADLRAHAFYEDLAERQALPFPPRFTATFRREFAQREARALKERTTNPQHFSLRCICMMSRLADLGLVGCLDLSLRSGPCASQVNGVCVEEGEQYVYIDNVAVDSAARRRGCGSAMIEGASDAACAWGAGYTHIYTHVHADNVDARRLYHRYGFRAPTGVPIAEAMSPGKAVPWNSSQHSGLVLLRAPLPLMRVAQSDGEATVMSTGDWDCSCGATFADCEECVCHPE